MREITEIHPTQRLFAPSDESKAGLFWSMGTPKPCTKPKLTISHPITVRVLGEVVEILSGDSRSHLPPPGNSKHIPQNRMPSATFGVFVIFITGNNPASRYSFSHPLWPIPLGTSPFTLVFPVSCLAVVPVR